MERIERLETTTAASEEEILGNIKTNHDHKYLNFANTDWWRDKVHLALVGGGPSLKDNLDELRDKAKYPFIMVCGSCHDYLVSQGIIPDFCVVVDPDSITINYIQNPCKKTLYLIASQCSPKLFKHLEDKGCEIYIWHADGGPQDDKRRLDTFGSDTRLVGGGCTVGTRAIVIAIGMHFWTIDLFGYDTCLTNDYKHHAYPFNDPNVETVGNITEIKLGGPDSPTFKVADYMLAQIFDFQNILKAYAGILKVTVHGGGTLAYLMEQGMNKAQEEISDG